MPGRKQKWEKPLPVNGGSSTSDVFLLTSEVFFFITKYNNLQRSGRKRLREVVQTFAWIANPSDR
jgi:hypothetical protein